MKKEDLIAMGLTEEQAKQVMDSLDGNYVTKTRFNQVNEELKAQKAAVSERDKQLEELKKSSGDGDTLKKQIEELQKLNKEQQKAHEAELAQLKLDSAVDSALVAAGAKNAKAVKALLDTSKLKLSGDSVDGLTEQLKELQKSDPYMFNETQQTTQNQQTLKGFQPEDSSGVKPEAGVDISKMTYSELEAYRAANPNIKIKYDENGVPSVAI